MTTSYGIDTSNHDVIDRNGGKTLDWAAIRRSGIDFAYTKVSDGLRFYTDPTAGAMLRGMRDNIPIWGGYHVLWGGISITAQLDWFGSLLDQHVPGWRDDPRCVAVWDCEPFSYNRAPTIAEVNQACDYWLQVVGRKALAYCPPWHYGGALNDLRYPLVSSNYGSNPVGYVSQVDPGEASPRWWATPQRKADVLQVGSRCRVDPYATIDGDVYLGTVDQIRALVTGGTTMADAMSEEAERILTAMCTRLMSARGAGESADRKRIKLVHPWAPEVAEVPNPIDWLAGRLDQLDAAVKANTPGQMTQDQVDAAVHKALSDPAVQDGIGLAIAKHLHIAVS